MKRLIRRLSRVADSSGSHPPAVRKRAAAAVVAEGHVPVNVGDEMERFEVRTELLGRPAFSELLRRSALEYGYAQSGVLRIPVPVPLFRRLLRSLADPDSAADEIVHSLPPGDGYEIEDGLILLS